MGRVSDQALLGARCSKDRGEGRERELASLSIYITPYIGEAYGLRPSDSWFVRKFGIDEGIGCGLETTRLYRRLAQRRAAPRGGTELSG